MNTASTISTRDTSVAESTDSSTQREGKERSGGSGGSPEHGRGTSPRAVGDQSDQSGATDRSGAERSEALLDSTQSYCSGSPDQQVYDDAQDYLRADTGMRRRVRWGARAVLWRASSLRSVRMCGQYLHGDAVGDSVSALGVPVRRRSMADGQAVAGFAGLATCGSVWACPRCSAVVAAQRSAEIGRAVEACQVAGGTVYMLTLTLRHRAGDDLAGLWRLLSAGWRGTFGTAAWSGERPRTRRRGGSTWIEPGRVGDRDAFGVAGYVRTVEATVSRPGAGGHGWHLHVHCLLFLVGDAAAGLRVDWEQQLTEMFGRPAHVSAEWMGRLALAAALFSRWARGVTRAGGRAPLGAGCDLRRVSDGGAQFIGSYLQKSTYDVAVRVGAEIAAGGETKAGNGALTPFQVLREASEHLGSRRFGVRTPRRWEVAESGDGWGVVDLDTGEVTHVTAPGLWPLWHTWELASRGRRQITWARRHDGPGGPLWAELLAARGEVEDDEAVAGADLQGVTLGEISRASWYARLVWRPSWLVEALEAAERSGAALCEWAEARQVEYSPR